MPSARAKTGALVETSQSLRRSQSWSYEEDERLVAIIDQMPFPAKTPNWNTVAERLGGSKSSKSCRLRWENQLKADIYRGPFEPEEDATIIKIQAVHGNKWARVARELTQLRVKKLADTGILAQNPEYPFRRTDNQVKNRWHAVLKGGLQGKKRKLQESHSGSGEVRAPKRARGDLDGATAVHNYATAVDDEEDPEGPETPRASERIPPARTAKRKRHQEAQSEHQPTPPSEGPDCLSDFAGDGMLLPSLADKTVGTAKRKRQQEALSEEPPTLPSKGRDCPDFAGEEDCQELTEFLAVVFPEVTDTTSMPFPDDALLQEHCNENFWINFDDCPDIDLLCASL